MNENALAIIPKSMGEVTSLAEVLSKSTLLPEALKGKVPDIVVQILAGQELGLAPMASIRGVHIVQGKPVLAADAMVALCLASGLAEYFSVVEETATQVTYETKRKGSPIPQRFTWSDDDTRTAGLNTKDNWRLHKRQMRRARCKSILARDVYPDVLAGCYSDDELQVPVREAAAPVRQEARPQEVIEDAEIVNEERIAQEMGNSLSSRLSNALSAIENATSVEQLKGEVAQVVSDMKLSSGAKVEAENAYKAKLKALRAQEAQPAPVTEPAA